MANFYYVKEGGTATGDAGRVATTRSTGSFESKGSANYYDDIQGAIAATTPPAAGDFIFISDASVSNDNAAIAIALPDAVQVWSVSDTNCDQYSAGATIDNTAAGDDDAITFTPVNNGWGAFHGITFNSDEGYICTASNPYELIFRECTFQKQHVSGSLMLWGGGSNRGLQVSLKDCTIESAHGSNQIAVQGCHCIVDNLSAGGGHTLISTLFAPAAGLASTYIEIINTDITALADATGHIFSSSSLDSAKFYARRCKIGASQTIYDGSITEFNTSLNASSVDTGDDYHYFYYETMFGSAEEDTAQYLNATYDGTNEFSTQIVTTAETSEAHPFKYKLCTLTSRDLSGASGETFKVELVSSDSGLTDTDVWIELEYQDNTDQALGALQDTRNADPLATGTALNSSSAVWAVTTNTEYDISETITQKSAVSNTNVTIYVYVAKPSITVNFDPAVDVT